MALVCTACGWKVLEPEPPTKRVKPLKEHKKCPNCGKVGTLKEESDTDEEEEEQER